MQQSQGSGRLMKAVILAGGFGTRLSEETNLVHKPLIEIGTMPIIWHIMKIYSSHQINEFIVCCGYKGYLIKEFFNNHALHASDVTINMADNMVTIHNRQFEPWKLSLIDTGLETMTGGRLGRIRHLLDESDDFCMTYGDGVGDIDITKLVDFHRKSGRRATLTAVRPPARFGALEISGDKVVSFDEKPLGDNGRINGGFFVLSPSVLDYIEGDDTVWEAGPLEKLAAAGDLGAFIHDGFWQPMDTLRDKRLLSAIWDSGEAPWKSW